MRASIFLSIAIALMLARGCGVGTQTYLTTQRQQIEQSARVVFVDQPQNTIVIAQEPDAFW